VVGRYRCWLAGVWAAALGVNELETNPKDGGCGESGGVRVAAGRSFPSSGWSFVFVVGESIRGAQICRCGEGSLFWMGRRVLILTVLAFLRVFLFGPPSLRASPNFAFLFLISLYQYRRNWPCLPGCWRVP